MTPSSDGGPLARSAASPGAIEKRYPILGFDPERTSVIEPSRHIKLRDLPACCVLTFSFEQILQVAESEALCEITRVKTGMGFHPVYRYAPPGTCGQVALVHPGVSAPLAASVLEMLIAGGCRTFVACGSAGVLAEDLPPGHLIIPTEALRDEGPSYHYLEPGASTLAAPRVVTALEQTLKESDIAYVCGKTWTTDAFYRETEGRVQKRKQQGCLTVEMEAAALFAVAQFREVALGCLLYASDHVGGREWDPHPEFDRSAIRLQMIELAARACLAAARGIEK